MSALESFASDGIAKTRSAHTNKEIGTSSSARENSLQEDAYRMLENLSAILKAFFKDA